MAKNPPKWAGRVGAVTDRAQYKNPKTNLYVKKDMIKSLNVRFIQIVEIPLKSYGVIGLFFKVESSLFCVINCKLQSGYGNSALRANDFN